MFHISMANFIKISNSRVITNSILIGIMLSCNFFVQLFTFIPNSIAILIFIPFFFLCKNNFEKHFQKKNCVIIFSILFIFSVFSVYSLFKGNFSDVTVKYISEFLVLGIPFLIVSNFTFSPHVVLKTIVLVAMIVAPTYTFGIDPTLFSYTLDGEMLMIISYNIVKMTLPAILLILLSKKPFLILFLSFYALISIFLLVNIGARGALVSLLVSIILLFIYRNNKQIHLFSREILLLTLVALLLTIFFNDIVIAIYEFLYSVDIYSISIERTIEKMNGKGTLDSGRSMLYASAINGFVNSLIIGNGIGSFDNYSGAYPHNLFLQQLYEGGLLFGMPISIVTLYSFRLLNCRLGKAYRYFLIYLISSSIIHLLFSSYFWVSSLYWFLVGLTFRFFVLKNRFEYIQYRN